jgi:branched-chain amino acid transport system substrate-binding protein
VRFTRLSFVLATAIILTSCGTDRPVRIGLAGPFSEARGLSMRLAAELAVEELNAAGGIGGRSVELAIMDDSARNERAALVAQQFAQDPSIVAVVGHLTSGTTLAAAPVYGGDDPVAAISPSASSPLVTDAGPWIFRVCPADDAHGARIAEWAFDRRDARRAAVMYLNDDYGRGIRTVFTGAFLERGGTIVSDDPYLDDLPSFAPYLERIMLRGGADVLVIAGTRTGAERILATVESLGLDIPVIGGDGLVGLEQVGSLAEGTYIAAGYLPDAPDPANIAFVEAYRAMTGNRVPDHRGAGAYDAIRLIAAAVSEVGSDRARVRDYLAGVGTRHPAFEGVTGTIAFDEHGDVSGKATVIGVVRDGTLHTVDGR